jgi:hypothetical protein
MQGYGPECPPAGDFGHRIKTPITAASSEATKMAILAAANSASSNARSAMKREMV